MASTFYDVLRVPRGAAADEIKDSYRALALLHHPDKSTTQEAAREFALLQEAWETLRDPVKRAEYDAHLAATDVDVVAPQHVSGAVDDDDFDVDDTTGHAVFRCRCGGGIVLEAQHHALKSQGRGAVLSCPSCSLRYKYGG